MTQSAAVMNSRHTIFPALRGSSKKMIPAANGRTIPPSIENTEYSDRFILPSAVRLQNVKLIEFTADSAAIRSENAVNSKRSPFMMNCDALEAATGVPTVVMDANDFDQNQLGKGTHFPLTDEQIQDAMADNPSGQGDELTPFILIHPLKD